MFCGDEYFVVMQVNQVLLFIEIDVYCSGVVELQQGVIGECDLVLFVGVGGVVSYLGLLWCLLCCVGCQQFCVGCYV